jgi:hypothetical protein
LARRPLFRSALSDSRLESDHSRKSTTCPHFPGFSVPKRARMPTPLTESNLKRRAIGFVIVASDRCRKCPRVLGGPWQQRGKPVAAGPPEVKDKAHGRGGDSRDLRSNRLGSRCGRSTGRRGSIPAECRPLLF